MKCRKAKPFENGVVQFLICRDCGDVTSQSVDPRIMAEFKNSIEASGVHLNNLELELDCICQDCSNHH